MLLKRLLTTSSALLLLASSVSRADDTPSSPPPDAVESAADAPPTASAPSAAMAPPVAVPLVFPPAALQAALDPKASTGLTLRDQARGFFNAMTAMGNGTNGTNHATEGTGFWLSVYTPQAYIATAAATARREYRVFGPAEVTEEIARPVLRVIVHPDKATDIRRAGDSVQHVVIRSTNKESIAVQPLSKEPFTESVQNIFGASAEYGGVVATFDLDAVTAVRRADKDGKGEFFITVVGEGSKKDFKVKTKHFDDLPGLK
jgi:hypothetical protein